LSLWRGSSEAVAKRPDPCADAIKPVRPPSGTTGAASDKYLSFRRDTTIVAGRVVYSDETPRSDETLQNHLIT